MTAQMEDLWEEFLRAERLRAAQQRHVQANAAMRQRLPGLGDFWANLTWPGTGAAQTPEPPTTGGNMITLLPEKEEIDATEVAHVRGWLSDTAQGKKKAWPNFPVVLRVNGKGRFVQQGVWECPPNSNNLFVGNEKGVQTPLWAPSAMMAIARYYRLDTDIELVKLIHEMLATIVAREVVPVMTELAVGYNGAPVTEIAVNKKERIFVGKYPGPDGKEGVFRHLSGEIAEINATDWVILRM